MYKVVGIEFTNSNRIYFFDPKNIKINKGDKIVVETERGLQLGIARKDIEEVDESKIVLPLKPVLRLANKDDISKYEKNKKLEEESIEKATKIASELELDMRFISSNMTLDKTQLTLNFLADERIDFRELAKKLANIYKTRIELRQIGVRDKAKKISGLGLCGQKLCCSRFLDDFSSVSIQMAKDQNIALNPTKINGLCGRLLCCLKYEEECYKECRKGLPNVGKTVTTSSGREGKVVSVDVLKRKYRVETPFGIEEEELGSIK